MADAKMALFCTLQSALFILQRAFLFAFFSAVAIVLLLGWGRLLGDFNNDFNDVITAPGKCGPAPDLSDFDVASDRNLNHHANVTRVCSESEGTSSTPVPTQGPSPLWWLLAWLCSQFLANFTCAMVGDPGFAPASSSKADERSPGRHRLHISSAVEDGLGQHLSVLFELKRATKGLPADEVGAEAEMLNVFENFETDWDGNSSKSDAHTSSTNTITTNTIPTKTSSTTETLSHLQRDAASILRSMPYQNRFCRFCNIWKSPRMHHCRTCGRCVSIRNHHCPFLANCVGEKNIGVVVLFYTFGFLVCIFCLLGGLGILLFGSTGAVARRWEGMGVESGIPIGSSEGGWFGNDHNDSTSSNSIPALIPEAEYEASRPDFVFAKVQPEKTSDISLLKEKEKELGEKGVEGSKKISKSKKKMNSSAAPRAPVNRATLVVGSAKVESKKKSKNNFVTKSKVKSGGQSNGVSGGDRSPNNPKHNPIPSNS
jgi:hypothetical protein